MHNILKDIVFLRMGQLLVNEMYKKSRFKVPIHLALGHEAIAVAVDHALKNGDHLLLSHRNIHYNMVREKRIELEIYEYLLKDNGLAKGKLGSMNLANPNNQIIYTSNILGNNLPVACGVALANKINNQGVTFVVTGDGAIEEGSFYESLLLMSSLKLCGVMIVENNGWSLATQIHERRGNIDIKKLTSALGIEYILLESNDVSSYIDSLKNIRDKSLIEERPICVEVVLSTLGEWYMKKEGYPNGKFINYHAGPAPTVKIDQSLVIDKSVKDPLHVFLKHFDQKDIDKTVNEFYLNLPKELHNELH